MAVGVVVLVLDVGAAARVGVVSEVGPMESLGSLSCVWGRVGKEQYQMQLSGLRLQA